MSPKSKVVDLSVPRKKSTDMEIEIKATLSPLLKPGNDRSLLNKTALDQMNLTTLKHFRPGSIISHSRASNRVKT